MSVALLSPREREVVRLIREGQSRRGVARRLHISVHTVSAYIRTAAAKLPGDPKLPAMKKIIFAPISLTTSD